MGIIRIHNLDFRWKRVVSFTSRLLYQRDILSRLLETWRWERWVMAKRRQVTTNLCCVTSEKSEHPPVFSKYKAGWAPEPFWTHGIREKSLASAGNRTMTALYSSPCPDRYIDYGSYSNRGCLDTAVLNTSSILQPARRWNKNKLSEIHRMSFVVLAQQI